MIDNFQRQRIIMTPYTLPDVGNNPLLINSVLETLFNLLDVENLKQCRYVCNIWNTESFRAIRKRAWINLTANLKQQIFLKSGVAHNFKLFSFRVSKWNEGISTYFSLHPPNQLEVDVDLDLNNDDDKSVQLFEYLLMSHANSIIELSVHVSCGRTTKLVVPEYLLQLKMPKLRKLLIRCGLHEVLELQNLCLSIFRNSPEIKKLDLRNLTGDELWSGISSADNFCKISELRYVHDRKTAILGMNQQLLGNRFPVDSLKRLCIPFQDSSSLLTGTILGKVAATLEILEFHTQDETALSPIELPVMHRLTTLDAGNSQFSFPLIVPARFPKLVEIKATYWDWVYTREDLPDVHYYWRTNDPHFGITKIHLRFPNWAALDFQYRKLENFADFSQVISSKFPAACRFTFHNVSLCNDVRQGLEQFTEVFEYSIKLFKIASYYSAGIHDASTFEVNASEGSKRQRELEVLDLSSEEWPEIWSKQPQLLSTVRDDWLPALSCFDKLHVLKLLWTPNLFARLDLTNKDVLPNLVHLEFVGNLCINRFGRAAVQRSRPLLCMVQHKSCLCEKEDWWYINDAQSDIIFQNLFSSESRGVTSFLKKILFHNLLV